VSPEHEVSRGSRGSLLAPWPQGHPSSASLNVDPGTPTPEQIAKWYSQDGAPIEKLLLSGAVRLLDAAWLIKYARRLRPLPPRQRLPEAAFVTVAQLQGAMPHLSENLRIVVLSYAWLTPAHPDPNAYTLQKLAQLLHVMLKYTLRGASPFRIVGVFWEYHAGPRTQGSRQDHSSAVPMRSGPSRTDSLAWWCCTVNSWGSLCQHAGGALALRGWRLLRRRSADEEALFRQALSSMALLYAHRFTYVVKSSSLPARFPSGYRLPIGHPVTPYDERGWCVTESAWATMIKSGGQVIDLALFRPDEHDDWLQLQNACGRAMRRPPLLPAAFEALIATKHFTNGRDDRPLVTRLYRTYFEDAFARVEKLRFNELGWTDADVRELVAVVLEPPGMVRLRELWLTQNHITEEGCHALVQMLDAGGLPELEMLFLNCNDFRPWEAGGLALKACAKRRGFDLHMQ